MSSRTLIYTANADSIDTFYGPEASKLLQKIYLADDRLTGRQEIRNGDPDNTLGGELFIVVDDDFEADNDLRNEISDKLIARVAAEKARVEYRAEAVGSEDWDGSEMLAAEVTWGSSAESISVRLRADGGLDSSGILDWNAITDDDGLAFAEWLKAAPTGDTFYWRAPLAS